MAYVTLTDPELGEVRVMMRRGSTRASARWDKGRVLMIVPPGTSGDSVRVFLERFRPFLAERRRVGLFEPGRPLVTEGGPVIHFRRTGELTSGIDARLTADGAEVRMAESFDLDDPQAAGVISRKLMVIARYFAPDVLLPEAESEARRLGLRPREIVVSRGYRVLGHCDAHGVIAISSACLFLPRDLRRFVVCHELAHLSEMNHSERFHALCDSYLGGRERELAAALKAYRWPLLR